MKHRELFQIILFYIILHLHSLSIFGQVMYTRTYGGPNYDTASCIQKAYDNCFIIVGGTTSFGSGSWDIYLLKIDSNGDTLWTRTYGGPDIEIGNYVQQTADGGYIIAAMKGRSWEQTDIYLIKTDNKGNTLWTRTYDLDYEQENPNYIQQTDDGGYIIAASIGYLDPGIGCAAIYLIKTDDRGEILWKHAYGGSSGECCGSLRQTPDGGFIIAGWTWSYPVGTNANIYMAKTDSNGDTLWTHTYTYTNCIYWSDKGEDVELTQDGGYLIAGSHYFVIQGIPYNNIFLIKTNASGDTLLTRKYGGTTGDERAISVKKTQDGNYIIAGSKGKGLSNLNDIDFYLIKIDPDCNILWSKTYGGDDWDLACSLQQTSDGGYIIVGETVSFGAGKSDVYIIKTDSYGKTGFKDKSFYQSPCNFYLLQNYPNPFNSSTNIPLYIPNQSKISLNIFDISGRLIKTLIKGKISFGNYLIEWDGHDQLGRSMPSGIYFYKLNIDDTNIISRKMILIK